MLRIKDVSRMDVMDITIQFRYVCSLEIYILTSSRFSFKRGANWIEIISDGYKH